MVALRGLTPPPICIFVAHWSVGGPPAHHSPMFLLTLRQARRSWFYWRLISANPSTPRPSPDQGPVSPGPKSTAQSTFRYSSMRGWFHQRLKSAVSFDVSPAIRRATGFPCGLNPPPVVIFFARRGVIDFPAYHSQPFLPTLEEPRRRLGHFPTSPIPLKGARISPPRIPLKFRGPAPEAD